jgi:hypothetical protein
MRRTFLGILAAGLLVGAVVAPATGATARYLGGVSLVGPQAVIWCSDDTPFLPGQIDKADLAGPGSVSFIVGDWSVGATITLRGAQPYTAYVIRVVQGTQYLPSSDCHRVDAIAWTDGGGNADVVVREPRNPYGNSVQVIIDTGAKYETPTYRGKAWMTFSPLVAMADPTGRAGAQAAPVHSGRR